MKYIKESPRITVKVYNDDTDELLLTITDRNWMNVGEVFPQHNVTALIIDEFKRRKKTPPETIYLVIGEKYVLSE